MPPPSRAATATSQPVSVVSAGKQTIRSTVLVVLLRTLAGALAVLALGRVVDAAVQGGSPASALAWAGGFLAARALLASVVPLLGARTAVRVERDLRRRVVDAVVAIGPTDADRRTGALVNQATEGVGAVGEYAGRFVPQLVGGIAAPLLLAAAVASVDLPTALVLVVLLPVVPGLLRGLERRFSSVTARYRETADRLAARFLDGVHGLRTLRAMDRAGDYGDSLAAESEHLRADTMRLLRVNQLALLGVDTLFTLGTVVAAAAMAAWRLSQQAVTPGEAVALVLLGVLLIEPLNQIGRFFYMGAIGRAAAGQIRRLLAAAPSVPAARAWSGEPGSVVVDAVRFAYPDGPDVLRDASLTVLPGEKVALVGPSGSGKSTLAALVAGLHRPTEGSVEVGGPVAVVSQRPHLFAGTVAGNLRLAAPGASDGELWDALDAAELGELVRSRGGLDTEVGEQGLRLSGGEAQRLAVARALLLDAPVVVLDEPTSNVDLDTEARLSAAIGRLTTGRTVLVIAHRRSTLAGCDREVHLDGGRLVEPGSTPVPAEEAGL